MIAQKGGFELKEKSDGDGYELKSSLKVSPTTYSFNSDDMARAGFDAGLISVTGLPRPDGKYDVIFIYKIFGVINIRDDQVFDVRGYLEESNSMLGIMHRGYNFNSRIKQIDCTVYNKCN